MKKIIAICIAASVLAFAGCDNNQKQIEELELEILALRAEKDLADSLQDQFYDFLNEIEENLATIKSKEKMISQVAGERPQTPQQKILQDLADISTLMDRNRNRLAELENLRRQMRNANVNTEKMQGMIEALEARIAEQEQQIKELQEQLRIANERIDVLKVENLQLEEDKARKQATIEEQTVALNTGYYTMGTTQALREAGVITQRGGFIGIGRTRTVNEEASLQNFSKVDIRQFTRLETNSEKIEIITPHPTESYRINNTDPKNMVIEITNADVFWKSSKFLVVRVR